MVFKYSMNVQKYNNSIGFKSGLTYNLVKEIRSIDIAKTQRDFATMGVDADFRSCKTICANFVMAANTLSDIAGRYKLPFNFVPPAIRVFKPEELEDESYNAIGFCNIDTKKILKDEFPFIGTSVFININNNNMLKNELNAIWEKTVMNWRSSSHFLYTTLHELFHCIHENLILTKMGYEGECPVLKAKYGRKNANGLSYMETKSNLPDVPDSDILTEQIGRYAANSFSLMEIFSELMTKITVEALDKKVNVVKNPMDNLPKKLPDFYKKEIEEILNI